MTLLIEHPIKLKKSRILGNGNFCLLMMKSLLIQRLKVFGETKNWQGFIMVNLDLELTLIKQTTNGYL